MRALEWDSLRFVLALADAGSYAAAGRALRVTHVTIMRQIATLESELGVKLFERGPDGFLPTAAGAEMAACARQIHAGIDELARRLEGKDQKLEGTVRITTTDTLFDDFVTVALANMRATYPDITYSVDLSNNFLDLKRGQADVAIRPSNTPPDTLVGRRVAMAAHAIYATAELARTLPREVDKRSNETGIPWVGLDSSLGHLASAQWLAQRSPVPKVAVTVNSLKGLEHAVRSGLGLGVMPCYMGDRHSDLTRIGGPIGGLHTEIWVLTHADLKDVLRIKTVTRILANAFKVAEATFDPSLRRAG
jgi:DNA-binding transcriptional LysR family regulator